MDEPAADQTRTIMTPRVLAARDGDVAPRRRELRRLADAARLLIERLVGTGAPDAVITETAAELEGVAERFAGSGPKSVYDGFAEAAMAGGDPSAFFDHSPLIGRANPLAPPITLEVVEGMIRGTATFGSAYEGPPGCVHGGYVAAAFDEVLGSAQTLSGSPGMTGTLTIRYRKPTPLHTELRFEGEFDRTEGRKVFTVGRVYADDVLTAEAEGIFVSIPPERFRELKEARDRRLA